MESLVEYGKKAKKAATQLGIMPIQTKNEGLLAVADELIHQTDAIIKANQLDIENAHKNNMTEALVDRLMVNAARIEAMADGIRQIAGLEDPIGEVTSMKPNSNGLLIGQKRVPLGVIGMIYESRPNVTADAFSLCFKTGNAVILRGGSDAIHSNTSIANAIRVALSRLGINQDAVQLIADTSRETATEMMKLNQYIDVLIPRGGAGLIQSVIKNSTIPVIETGTGNCHVFVDEHAQFTMAKDIIINAKTQRLGTCNTCESLVIHKKIADEFIPLIAQALVGKDIAIHGDELACKLDDRITPATEEDWGTEYLDRIISLKTVDSLDEAIDHINNYNTQHSDAIITDNYFNAQRFLNEIDSAAVYVNASTRFTDGYEFGFGAEIGISTQKIHARGPMGLLALTTTKYIIYGTGQIRE